MKHKTAELEGELIDIAVALALGIQPNLRHKGKPLTDCYLIPFDTGPSEGSAGDIFQPSTRWDHGGPIIERQKFGLVFQDGQWMAGDLYTWQTYYETTIEAHYAGYGPTPLIAAMRAYVTSVFGEEVEIP